MRCDVSWVIATANMMPIGLVQPPPLCLRHGYPQMSCQPAQHNGTVSPRICILGWNVDSLLNTVK